MDYHIGLLAGYTVKSPDNFVVDDVYNISIAIRHLARYQYPFPYHASLDFLRILFILSQIILGRLDSVVRGQRWSGSDFLRR